MGYADLSDWNVVGDEAGFGYSDSELSDWNVVGDEAGFGYSDSELSDAPLGDAIADAIGIVLLGAAAVVGASAALGGLVGYRLGGWRGALVGAPLGAGAIVGGYYGYWALQPKPVPGRDYDPRFYPMLPPPP